MISIECAAPGSRSKREFVTGVTRGRFPVSDMLLSPRFLYGRLAGLSVRLRAAPGGAVLPFADTKMDRLAVSCLAGVLVALLVSAPARFAVADHLAGVGVTVDSDDGLAATAFGDVALGDRTWLSAVASHSNVGVPGRPNLDAWYAELSLDHDFDPFGVRAGVAYWGDSDLLDSIDWRGSVYWKNDRLRIAAIGERRDFDFIIPETRLFPGREVSFDADGLGASIGIDLTSSIDLYLSGIDYEYSVNLRLDDRQELLRLFTVSRLSLINSLVDFRASATLGADLGDQRVSLEYATWRGEVDGGDTRSVTLRWLAPLGERGDIEFGLGYDDSELYGEVTLMSVYLFFYGD
jgi:hypothetical protein